MNNGIRKDQWPARYPGGKFYLAQAHIDLFPRHRIYVEPFAGGLQTLGRRDPFDPRFLMPGEKGVGEIVNDLNRHVVNFWRVVRDHKDALLQLCRDTPFSETIFKEAVEYHDCQDHLRSAYYYFILMRMSLTARQETYTSPTISRLRMGMQAEVSSWINASEALTACCERLRRVNILDASDALEIMPKLDDDATFFYLDPEYHPAGGHEEYIVTRDQNYQQKRRFHLRLIETITMLRGKVMLCGYRNEDYDRLLHSWRVAEFPRKLHSAKGSKKPTRIECVYMNYPPREEDHAVELSAGITAPRRHAYQTPRAAAQRRTARTQPRKYPDDL